MVFGERSRIPKKTIKKTQESVHQAKLTQLQKSAVVRTPKEKEDEQKARVKRTELFLEEQKRRISEFEAYDSKRKGSQKLNEFEEESKMIKEHMRIKADEIINEQNEEIKILNKMILSAKVQAIRDAQVLEKKQIKKELTEAEAFLDHVMEEERKKNLFQEQEIQKLKKESAHKAALKLQEQITDNQEKRMMEEKKRNREGKLLLNKLNEEQFMEIEEMKIQHLKKKQFLEDLTKETTEGTKRKEAMKEQSRKEDLMLAEYQRIKAAKDEAKEAAEREEKQKRQAELVKIGKTYQKASDIKAEQESLRARRAQEEKEREYRKKEKAEAIRKKEMAINLKKSRDEQLALQADLKQQKEVSEMKEAEIQKKKIQEEAKTDMGKVMEKKMKSIKHLAEIRDQIKQKEIEKIHERKDFFEERLQIQLEEKRRNEMLDYIKKKKINELKKYNIPEAYINHIKKKVELNM